MILCQNQTPILVISIASLVTSLAAYKGKFQKWGLDFETFLEFENDFLRLCDMKSTSNYKSTRHMWLHWKQGIKKAGKFKLSYLNK